MNKIMKIGILIVVLIIVIGINYIMNIYNISFNYIAGIIGATLIIYGLVTHLLEND